MRRGCLRGWEGGGREGKRFLRLCSLAKPHIGGTFELSPKCLDEVGMGRSREESSKQRKQFVQRP